MHDEMAGIRKTVAAIVRMNEPVLFYLQECVDAYEKAFKKREGTKHFPDANKKAQEVIESFPWLSSCRVALEALHERLVELRDVLITNIEKDAEIAVKLAVEIRNDSRASPGFTLEDPNLVRTTTDVAHRAEQNGVGNVQQAFSYQVQRVSILLERIKKLEDARRSGS